MFRVGGSGGARGDAGEDDGAERNKPSQKRGSDYQPIIRVISDQIGVNY